MTLRPRPRPLSPRVIRCQRCTADIVWAITTAGPNGPGGKRMPLDPYPNEAGNVAVRVGAGGRLTCRVLGNDDVLDRLVELPAMPHFATCGKQLVDEVEAFLREAAEGGAS